MIYHLVFDMDGVLVDTEPLVRRAYREVGVDMPTDAFGQPWMQWLPQMIGSPERSVELHKEKNKKYAELMEDSPPRPLPACDIARDVLSRHPYNISVLTGASASAVRSVLIGCGLVNIPVLAYGVTQEEKYRILGSIRTRGGVYVDDQPFVAPTGWRVVQYNGQTKKELEQEIWTR